MTHPGCPAETSEELILSPSINEIFETRISGFFLQFNAPSSPRDTAQPLVPGRHCCRSHWLPAFHAKVGWGWDLHCWALAHSCLAATGKTLPSLLWLLCS